MKNYFVERRGSLPLAKVAGRGSGTVKGSQAMKNGRGGRRRARGTGGHTARPEGDEKAGLQRQRRKSVCRELRLTSKQPVRRTNWKTDNQTRSAPRQTERGTVT